MSLVYFEVVASRKRSAFTADGVEFERWSESKTPILRYETVYQGDAERYARRIYQTEGCLPAIYRVERVPA